MSNHIGCIFKYCFDNCVVLSFIADCLQLIAKQSQPMNKSIAARFNKFDAILLLAIIMCILFWQFPFFYLLCRSRYVFVSPLMMFTGLAAMRFCKPAYSYSYSVPFFLLLLIFWTCSYELFYNMIPYNKTNF